MESLDGVSQGRYAVFTESGTVYELDMGNHTLARRPDKDAQEPNPLRRDQDRVTLLAVRTCHIGERAVFLIDLRFQGVEFTARRTTPVWRIEVLGAGLDDTGINAEFDDLVAGWDGAGSAAND